MALVGNGVRLSASNPMRQSGAASAGAITRASWGTPGSVRNQFQAFSPYQGTPSGYVHPGAWTMPQKGGGISSRFETEGTGTVAAANLAGGLYGEASLSGTGTIATAAATFLGQLSATVAGLGGFDPSPTLAGALDAAAAMSGTGTISAATLAAVTDIAAALVGVGDFSTPPTMAGVLAAVASLSGAGDVTGANLAGVLLAAATILGTGTLAPAQLDGRWEMDATLAGTGSVASAITAIGHAAAALAGTGAASFTVGATPGFMSADVSPFTELSPQNLAAAVWNSVVSAFQEAGSMGEALGAAGSGGLTPTQATMIEELYRLAGLDATRPLVVTATTREAGAEIEQDITEAPAGTITVTRL